MSQVFTLYIILSKYFNVIFVSCFFFFLFSDYVDCLIETAFAIGKVSDMNEGGLKLLIEAPPPLCNEYERPDKETAVQNLLSRFSCSLQSESQCSSGLGQEKSSGSS